MNIHELMPKFPPSCYIKEQILLVNPNEFHRLEGIDIDSSRVFIVVSEGSIDINLNGKRCKGMVHAGYIHLCTELAEKLQACTY